jgi:hypothetical protein
MDYNPRMASAGHGSLPGKVEDIRLVVDTIPGLVWSTRPDGSAEFFNHRWLEYTGLARIAGIAFRRRRTTKSLAVPNPSWRGPLQPGTSSSWSRIQKSTPRRPAGGSVNSTRTANLAPRQISKNASSAIRLSEIVTSSSLVTHLDAESGERSDDTMTAQLKNPEQLERSTP